MIEALGVLAIIAAALLVWVLILMFVRDFGKRQPQVRPGPED